MKIPVPEVDERFDTTEDALEHIARMCGMIVDKAKVVCPIPSVNDLPAYALVICEKIVIQAKTIVRVARQREDYNSVCSLVRILADNICTLNLIYGCEDIEERILRHLLYVLDGVSQRFELLSGHPMKYDGTIPHEAYEQLRGQVEGAKKNAEECIQFCETTIRRQSCYAIQSRGIEELLKQRNWKFKTVDKPNHRDAYSWKEMYNRLGIKEGDKIFPFFSQYVHGLSVSNIALGDKEDFQAPLSFAICLLGWLFYYLRKVYEPHIGEYTLDDLYKIVPELKDYLKV